MENGNAFLATINIHILLTSSIRIISFWTCTIYGTWFQQLLCHSTMLRMQTLYSISTLNQQPNNLEQTHIRCSLHCERWTVKDRDCASVLHSFKKITYRTDEWTKHLLRLKCWVISGSPEQRMVFRFLWWLVFVFKCSYFFQLFDFSCLLEQLLFFLRFYFFVSFPWWLWVRSKSSLTTSMQGNTP